MDDPSFSRPFNGCCWSTHEEVRAYINEAMPNLEQWARNKLGRERAYSKEWAQHLAHVTLEAFLTHCAHPSLYMAVPLRKEWYSNNPEIPHLSYTHIRLVTDFLIDHGFLELFEGKKGWQDPTTGIGFRTRMRATPYLIAKMEDYGINRFMITRFSGCPDEVIILRDAKQGGETVGKQLPYKDTDFTILARSHLRKINEFIQASCLNLCITDTQQEDLEKKMMGNSGEGKVRHLDFTDTQLRRIFNNGSFEEGGRFYGGWWQHIPSEYRPLITINGKKTVELDYSGMHFAIMYALHGLEVPMEDPYALEGIDPSLRPQIKKAFNAIVNCGTEEEATGLVNIKIANKEWPSGLGDGQSLLNAFRQLHEPISDMIASAHGTKAQFIDSEIAERVMLKGIEDGLCILPVHDSFIVRAGNEQDLRQYMAEVFQEVLGQKADMGLVELKEPILLASSSPLKQWATLKDGTEIEGYVPEQSDELIIGYGEVVGVESLFEDHLGNMSLYDQIEEEWNIAHKG